MSYKQIIIYKICAITLFSVGCSRSGGDAEVSQNAGGSEAHRFKFKTQNLTAGDIFLNNFAQRMVKIETSGLKSRKCSGFIFDEKHIITARHCIVLAGKSENIKITLFDPNFQNGELDSKPIQIECIDLSSIFDTDFALLEYKKPNNSYFNTINLKQDFVRTLEYFKEAEIETQNAQVLGFHPDGFLWSGSKCKIIDNWLQRQFQLRHNCATQPTMSGGILLHHFLNEKGDPILTSSRLAGMHLASDGDLNQAALMNSEIYAFAAEKIPNNARAFINEASLKKPYAPEIDEAITKNVIFDALLDKTFNLKRHLRRSELVGFLMRILSDYFGNVPRIKFNNCTSTFKDIDTSVPYCKEIVYARDLKLITGYNNYTEFRPNGTVSRAQLASTIFWFSKRAIERKIPGGKILVLPNHTLYTDIDTEWTVGKEIIALSSYCDSVIPKDTADKNLFRPYDNASIEDALIMMVRINKCISNQIETKKSE